MEPLLTVKEVVTMLSISKRHVYELMNERTRSGDVRQHPLPYLKLGNSVRFRKEAIEGWLQTLAATKESE